MWREVFVVLFMIWVACIGTAVAAAAIASWLATW